MQPSAEAEATAGASENSVRTFSLRERLQLFLITWAGYLFIRLIGPTLRYQAELEPGARSDGLNAQTGIWCFWHRSVIPAAWRFRDKRIIGKFGFGAVRGSSSRGAVGALLGMRRELELGHPVAFTIDGPRGPRYVAKPGPILLAKKTGFPVSCFFLAAERAWILNSWDRMIIPKPFSRVTLHVSSPIFVPADASDEQMAALHQQMQESLERCMEKAEAAMGVTNATSS
jgi:lysophospholipid acyltransferase (LPLAT)-like uncharacterized protein